ncbi:MAG: hypothetical protein IKP47_09280 [Ruminococcus sp.]|nr:hypothetical protein [Ruminococcus sp.]
MKRLKTKNTDQGIIAANGIKIDGDISFSTGLRINRDLFFLIRPLIALIASLCTVFILASFLDTNVQSIYSVFLTCTAFALIVTKQPAAKLIGIACLIVQVIFIVFLASDIYNGLFAALDRYFTKADMLVSDISRIAGKLTKDQRITGLQRFMSFISFLVPLLTSIACTIRFDFVILFISTFPFLEIGLYHGWEAPTAAVIGLIVCWISVLSLSLINHSTNKAGVNNTFAVHRRKKAYYFTSRDIKNKFFTIYLSSTALICAAVFAAAVLFSSVSGFVRPKAFKELRRDITEAFHSFSFEKLSDMLADYEGGFDLFAVKSVGGINGGRLGRQDGISFDGSTALNVKILSRPEASLYLKGYAAGKYEDNCWDPIDEEPGDELTEAFEQAGIPFQNFNHEQYKNSRDFSPVTQNTISVAVSGASKRFVYAPYMADYNTSTDYGFKPMDESYVKLGDKSYVIDFYDYSKRLLSSEDKEMNILLNMVSEGSGRNSRLNKLYKEFVYANYLDVNNSDVLSRTFETIVNRYVDLNLMYDDTFVVECAAAIRSYFADTKSYGLTPGKTPDGEDFIDYFLENQHEAYCSYFASAGTMLMRMFGFPARYCEGFIVTPSEFEMHNSGEYTVLEADITDKSAHAWCEVFVDGIGWMPLEFTPGYSPSRNPNIQPAPVELPGGTSGTSQTVTAKPPAETGSGQSKTVTSIVPNSPTETTTTEKQAAPVNSGTGSNGNGQSGSGSDSGSSYTIKAIIAAAGLVLFTVLVIVLNRSFKVRKKYRLTHSSDSRKAIKYIYVYYLKYLSLIKIANNENVTDEKEALKLMYECHEQELDGVANELSKLSELAIEAQHSNNDIPEEECREASLALSDLSKLVSEKLGTFGRLSAKWIMGLY